MSTVIVIDDQSIGRMILEELVRSIGDEVEAVSFADPIEALEWAKHHAHDLVLTDYKMPNMDGIEFTQWLRKIPSCTDVPVIMITCMDDKAVRYRALEVGATDFITKPIDHHECRARCTNLLRLRQQQVIIRDRARWLENEINDKTRALRLREQETLRRLAKAGEYRDQETGEHVERISHLSRYLALKLGEGTDFCDTLEHASPMHDIGKIGVPDFILTKPGSLTKRELRVMREHTVIGYEILRDSPSQYLQMGATIAWCHHERYDGEGYPRRLSGVEIPLEARIVALADVFDALLSTRPYKSAWSLDETVSHIRSERGKHFDPDCVDALLSDIDDTSRELNYATLSVG